MKKHWTQQLLEDAYTPAVGDTVRFITDVEYSGEVISQDTTGVVVLVDDDLYHQFTVDVAGKYYIAGLNEIEVLTPVALACDDCGLPYKDFALDVNLPRGQWLAIHEDDGGILCANCILRRAVDRIPGVTVAHMVFEVTPPLKPIEQRMFSEQ